MTKQKQAWLDAGINAELAKIRQSGNQNYGKSGVLFPQLCAIAQFIHGKHIQESDVLAQVENVARDTWPDLTEKEFSRQWSNAMKKTESTPRQYVPRVAVPTRNSKGKAQPRPYMANGHSQTNGVNGSSKITSEPKPADSEYTFGRGRSFHPYSFYDSRAKVLVDTKDGEIQKPVCDFEAIIDQVIYDEDGQSFYTIRARGHKSGKVKELEIRGEDFENSRKLAGRIGALFPRDPVHAEMSKHLPPLIKLASDDVKTVNRYHRVGWNGKGFLIDGNLPANTVCEMPEKSPYSVRYESSTSSDLSKQALNSLILSLGPQTTLPVLMAAFYAPLAHKLDMRNQRYVVYLTGRTGSLKTTFGYLVQSLYGADWHLKSRAVSWKDSRLSIMNMMTMCCDMPLLIDNYKPNTGSGERGLVQMVHDVVEGTDRSTMSRDRKQRTGKDISCIPIFTGEALPYSDMATLARGLPLVAPWQGGRIPEHIKKAQELVRHLPAVGYSWIKYLEKIDDSFKDHWLFHLGALRSYWADVIENSFPKIENKLRIISTMATTLMTFDILADWPEFGDVFRPYRDQLIMGLHDSLSLLDMGTEDAMESTRFLNGMRTMISIGRLILPRRDQYSPEGGLLQDKDRLVGFQDQTYVYLLPASVETYKRFANDDLNGFNTTAIGRQLKQMEVLISKDKKGRALTNKISVSGMRLNVWQMRKDKFFGEEKEKTDDAGTTSV